MFDTITLILGILGGVCVVLAWRVRQYRVEMQRLYEELNQARTLKAPKEYNHTTARAVLKGQIAEQFAPVLPGFKYNPKDFRFIGNPIDGIIVVGLSEAMEGLGTIHEIVLCDIKMGKSQLSPHQNAIRQAIEAKRVRWETIHVDQEYRVTHTR